MVSMRFLLDCAVAVADADDQLGSPLLARGPSLTHLSPELRDIKQHAEHCGQHTIQTEPPSHGARLGNRNAIPGRR
jgi:hypothetical protein